MGGKGREGEGEKRKKGGRKGKEKGREGKEGKWDGCVMAFGGMDAPIQVIYFGVNGKPMKEHILPYNKYNGLILKGFGDVASKSTNKKLSYRLENRASATYFFLAKLISIAHSCL